MSVKLMTIITKALKKASVEINDEAKDILSEALGSSSLEGIGLAELSPGHKMVEESVYNDLIADNKRYRKRSQDAEAKRDEYKATLDAGDSDNKKRAERFETRNKELEPRMEKLTKRARADWANRAKTLPELKADAKDDEKQRVENIRKRFVLPEKDKELEDDQVLANLAAYDDLDSLGIFVAQQKKEDAPTPPPAPRGGGGGSEPIDLNAAYGKFYGDKKAAGNAR